MKDMLQERWRVSDDAIANPVGDETVILHLGNGTYYGLDTIGSILWEGLKGGRLPSEVCSDILEQYDVDEDTVHTDIRRFLGELHDNELVTKG